MPVRVLLALLAVVAVIAVIVWWFAIPWTMPAGSSIAVVDFAETNAAGNLSTSTYGKQYAQSVWQAQMSSEVNALPLKPVPTIWHIASGLDPVAAFFKRIWVAPVGTDQDAEALTARFGPQVVAYGVVEVGDEGVNVSPKFFAQQAHSEADKLADPQQMGQAITVDKDNDNRLNTHLYPLSKALLYFTEGLWAQLDGDFIKSYSIFNQAEANLRDELALHRELGKEVLYYFFGRVGDADQPMRNGQRNRSFVTPIPDRGTASVGCGRNSAC